MTKTFKIAVYPGDGIGPEVTAEALKVLSRVQELDGSFKFDLTHLPWGVEYFKQHGNVVPENFLDVVRPFDAILLGAVGWPELIPDHITLAPLVKIRQAFDQYACVRPSKLYPGVKSVLAGKGPAEVDFVVIRENSEGEYVDNGGRLKRGTLDEVAVQTALHTRKGVERILRYGFQLARTRRRQLTMATKSNAQRYGYVLWDEVLEELRPQYADVTAERQHCDALIMNLVRWPEKFDVIVASNLFGDLLTDLGGVIAGGLGLAPSTNTNPERRYPSMFEPVHGSAPDIAGKGIANPVAAILSAAMMLDWLGETEAGTSVRSAVERALAGRALTPDVGGKLKTTEVTAAIVKEIR